ncbi:MAG: hypothetical protein M1393_05030 [Candidatus Thermoplasmatota archaeon]|nr:hypothetical protein [Candidatus Thermoplasmatota archaeon]MCL6090385.1 hypothetical protein [Candidatus Thermoplasmatota archaeon]
MSSIAGTLAYPISSFILISAFYMQGQEFIRPMIRGQLIQSLLIAAVSFIVGFSENNIDFIILGIFIVFLRGALVTYFLEKGVPSKKVYFYEKKVDVAYLLLVDLIFIVIAVFLIYSIVFSSISIKSLIGNNGILVFPLTLFFQGLFLIASRRTTFAQIIGYVEEENALVLFALFLLPIPIIIEASVFMDVLALVVISSIVVIEKSTHERVEELIG